MEKSEVIQILAVGTGGILFLVTGVIAFYLIYQRRILRQEQLLIKKELEHQKELLAAAVSSQERERKRIAADLHDDVGNRLQALNLYLQRMKSTHDNEAMLLESLDILGGTIKGIRDLSHSLLPVTLTELGFQKAALMFCERLNSVQSLNFKFLSNSAERVSETTELALYRILQELTTNTIKHTSAKSVEVDFAISELEFRLSYQDDGPGINEESLQKTKGLGFHNVESRCRMIGASLEFPMDNETGFKAIISGHISQE